MSDFTRVRWDSLRAARAKCRKNVVEAERSGDSDRIHTARWEPVPQPQVKRVCQRCRPKMQPGGVLLVSGIVSPRGVAHHGNDNGMTDCGVDATGPNWWWPL